LFQWSYPKLSSASGIDSKSQYFLPKTLLINPTCVKRTRVYHVVEKTSHRDLIGRLSTGVIFSQHDRYVKLRQLHNILPTNGRAEQPIHRLTRKLDNYHCSVTFQHKIELLRSTAE